MKHFYELFASIVGLVLCVSTQAATNETNPTSFTPVSYKFPITGITFYTSNGKSQVYYSCSSNCTVDLKDSNAVNSFFNNVSGTLPADTYTSVWLNTCAGKATTYNVLTKGTVVINGTTYYTTSDPNNPISTSASAYDYATLPITGCSVSGYFPSGFTPGTSGTTVTLYSNMKNVLWAATAGISSGLGGCKVNGSGLGVCTTLPAVIPYGGTGTASSETYLISTETGDTSAAKANGQILVFLDANGKVMGGTTRVYYTPSTITDTSMFDSGWLSFTTPGSNTLSFNTDGRLTISASAPFTRSSTIGTTGTGTLVNGSGSAVTYYSIRQ